MYTYMHSDLPNNLAADPHPIIFFRKYPPTYTFYVEGEEKKSTMTFLSLEAIS